MWEITIITASSPCCLIWREIAMGEKNKQALCLESKAFSARAKKLQQVKRQNFSLANAFIPRKKKDTQQRKKFHFHFVSFGETFVVRGDENSSCDPEIQSLLLLSPPLLACLKTINWYRRRRRRRRRPPLGEGLKGPTYKKGRFRVHLYSREKKQAAEAAWVARTIEKDTQKHKLQNLARLS